MLYLIGDSDPLLPLSGGKVKTFWGKHKDRPPLAETIRQWKQANDLPDTSTEVRQESGVRIERYSRSPERIDLEILLIHGLGHHWPGGKGGLGERLGGPLVDRVKATERIWDFFRRE